MLRSLAVLLLFGGHALGQSLDGFWTGALEAGGTKLRLTLTIGKAVEGAFTGTLDSLDQGAVIPIDKISLQGDGVKLELHRIRGVFEGKLSANRNEMTGAWTQGGSALPLVFQRGTAPDAAAKPAGPPREPFPLMLDLRVPVAPTPVSADGKVHLVYELHVLNFGDDCALVRLEAAGKKYEGDDLASLLIHSRKKNPAESKLKISAGMTAVILMWITVDRWTAIPQVLTHKLTIKSGDYPKELTAEAAPVKPAKGPAVISPPLRGGGWLAANGPSNKSAHRTALLPIGGVAQRFAIDFVRVNPDGQMFTGDPAVNKNHLCYGAEALAVADGTVAGVKDGIPENTGGASSRAVPVTMETVGGNHVVLDIGNGRYAFYAHLQPGSLRVKAGGKVRRGDVLGLVGNSGNSTAPHLHFQLGDSPQPLGGAGLPYVIPRFERQGSGFGPKSGSVAMEIPLQDDVVAFPDVPREPAWKPVASWPPVPASVKWDKPSAMTLDAQDRLIIFQRGAPALLRYGAAGKFLDSWSSGYFKMAHGLKVAPDGAIWVTDAQKEVIVKFSPQGKQLLVLGTPDQRGDGKTHFNGVADLAFLPNGDFYVADGYRNSRIVKFDKNGKYLFEWGKPGTGPGEFHLPHAIALDAKGQVYVGDRENRRIQIFNGDGKYLKEWHTGWPYGLTFGPDGALWMSDGIENRVVKIDSDGKIVDSIELPVETADGTGGHMVAVGRDGSVYVAETGRYLVRKYRKQP